MSTSTTWNHPEWGQFTFNGYAWEKSVPAPAFDAFVRESRYGKPTPRTGNYDLSFDADDESDVPSDAAVAVAAAVLANQNTLVSQVTAALWEDFNGRGPDSGMWWHDDMDSVSEDIEPVPDGPEDLLRLMQLNRITIQKSTDGYDDKPVAKLDFNAEFEEEHGVGILTDGTTILGAGYAADASPYE